MLRLKFLRLERELSQRELAVLAKVTQPELSRIESGRTNPNQRELQALARALGCAPDQLLDHVSVTEASRD